MNFKRTFAEIAEAYLTPRRQRTRCQRILTESSTAAMRNGIVVMLLHPCARQYDVVNGMFALLIAEIGEVEFVKMLEGCINDSKN